jgi:hypothetical protein
MRYAVIVIEDCEFVTIAGIRHSRAAAEKLLADLMLRYTLAKAEFDAWCDSRPDEWSEQHAKMLDVVLDKYRVDAALTEPNFQVCPF